MSAPCVSATWLCGPHATISMGGTGARRKSGIAGVMTLIIAVLAAVMRGVHVGRLRFVKSMHRHWWCLRMTRGGLGGVCTERICCVLPHVP